MREYNLAARETPKLKFYGMDGSRRWMSTRTAVRFVSDYLDKVNPVRAGHVRRGLLPLAEEINLKNAGEIPNDAICNLVRGLVDLVGHLEVEQMHYVELSTFDDFDWAHRAALIASRIGAILSATHADPPNAQRYRWNIRDAGMATELKWILEREGSDARLLVGAANIHLQKVFASGGRPTAGQHLSLYIPQEDLVMIAGTNYFSLKPEDPAIEGSFQEALGELKLPSFVLDLRSAKLDEKANLWLNQERPDRSGIKFSPVNAGQAWDAVYFTHNISIDTLNLPGPFQRTYIGIEPDQLNGLEGVYDIVGIGDNQVVLCIYRNGNRLLTDGADSDGELFPMHRSELFPLSLTRFAWREWPHEVEFDRDDNGIARGLNLRAPGAFDRFYGFRRRQDK
jgi:hypothetical protein